jgi:hypothetical protein
VHLAEIGVLIERALSQSASAQQVGQLGVGTLLGDQPPHR